MRKKDPRKEEAIYKAVLSICKDKSLASLTMSAIAKRAGLAAGTLYIYFNSKEELFNEMYDDLWVKRSRSILANLEIIGQLREDFENFWFAYLEYLLDHTDELLFCKQFELLNVDFDNTTNSGQKGLSLHLHTIIDKGNFNNRFETALIPIKEIFLIRSLEELVLAHYKGEVLLDTKGIEEAFRMASRSLIN